VQVSQLKVHQKLFNVQAYSSLSRATSWVYALGLPGRKRWETNWERKELLQRGERKKKEKKKKHKNWDSHEKRQTTDP